MISVFIPTVPWHINIVPVILEKYYTGVRKPDQIVVYCSGAKDLSARDTLPIRRNFPGVKLVMVNKLVQAGPARQQALELCDGDIIIYQDSDDLPHEARVHVVNKYFSLHPEVMVLHHSYCYKSWEQGIDYTDISDTVDWKEFYDQYFPGDDFMACRAHHSFGDICRFPLHAGVPCIKKEVLKHVKWLPAEELTVAPDPKEKTEDFEFSMSCLYKYKDLHHILGTKVYLYRG